MVKGFTVCRVKRGNCAPDRIKTFTSSQQKEGHNQLCGFPSTTTGMVYLGDTKEAEVWLTRPKEHHHRAATERRLEMETMAQQQTYSGLFQMRRRCL